MTGPGQTVQQIEAAAIAAERAAVVAYGEEQAGQVQAMLERGKVSADEATLLTERMRAFTGAIAAGLHIPDRSEQ